MLEKNKNNVLRHKTVCLLTSHPLKLLAVSDQTIMELKYALTKTDVGISHLYFRYCDKMFNQSRML